MYRENEDLEIALWEEQQDRDDRHEEINAELTTAIDTFKVGDRFTLKSHKDSEYEVTGFWTGRSGHRFMDVRDLKRFHIASSCFADVNLESFETRGEIERTGGVYDRLPHAHIYGASDGQAVR
jgi:hypothetical protein